MRAEVFDCRDHGQSVLPAELYPVESNLDPYPSWHAIAAACHAGR